MCVFFLHIFLVLFPLKDAGSQQIGFLLGSCGVAVALTSDACHKGLPKNLSGDIVQFKGWRLSVWFRYQNIISHLKCFQSFCFLDLSPYCSTKQNGSNCIFITFEASFLMWQNLLSHTRVVLFQRKSLGSLVVFRLDNKYLSGLSG